MCFAFHAEIQDGHQKWRENDFCKMSPVQSADTMQVQNFVKIALSHTVSEMNALLRFTQKFKMATKSGRKAIFAKKSPVDCIYPVGQKISAKSLYHTPFPREVFLTFHAEIQDGHQKWQESDFCKKSPVHSGHPGG